MVNVKTRWVFLPPGTTIDARDDRAWDFPVGTRFWKEFTFNGRKVETRMLWKATAAKWVAASYLWNEDQTDATLASDLGEPDVAAVASTRQHSIPSLLHDGDAVASSLIGRATVWRVPGAGDGRSVLIDPCRARFERDAGSHALRSPSSRCRRSGPCFAIRRPRTLWLSDKRLRRLRADPRHVDLAIDVDQRARGTSSRTFSLTATRESSPTCCVIQPNVTDWYRFRPRWRQPTGGIRDRLGNTRARECVTACSSSAH